MNPRAVDTANRSLKETEPSGRDRRQTIARDAGEGVYEAKLNFRRRGSIHLCDRPLHEDRLPGFRAPVPSGGMAAGTSNNATKIAGHPGEDVN